MRVDSLWQRLWWALVGYRTVPWPVPLEHNRLPGGVFSEYQGAHLRGSLKLAVDLIAPHFQSRHTGIDAEGIFVEGIFEDHNELNQLQPAQYLGPSSAKQEIDILVSGAAWLAKHEKIKREAFDDICDAAGDDVFEVPLPGGHW